MYTFCTKIDGRKFGKIPLESLDFRVLVSVARNESDNRQSLQKSSLLSLSIVRFSAKETEGFRQWLRECVGSWRRVAASRIQTAHKKGVTRGQQLALSGIRNSIIVSPTS